MTNRARRSIKGASSIVVASGLGIVTNVATDQSSAPWWVFLAALVLCSVGLELGPTLLERRGSQATGQEIRELNEKAGESEPVTSAVKYRNHVNLHAGNSISFGSGSHYLVVIALAAMILVTFLATLVIVPSRKSDGQSSSGTAVSSSAAGLPAPLPGTSRPTAKTDKNSHPVDVSPSGPDVRRSGSQTLAEGLGVDLDSGNQNWGGGGGDNVNFGIFDQRLGAYHGARMAASPHADYGTCKRLALSAVGIPANTLKSGQQFCVKTPLGHYASVTIVKARMESYMVYDIKILVWD